jgi:LAO/AO transport system kinase
VTTEELIAAVRRGDRRALARAITLIESTRPDHRDEAERLVEALLPQTGGAVRIGISGPPGAGKSTFIERFGLDGIALGRHVAVLAVDPASKRGGGAILGDKTRMFELAKAPEAFIRPSSAGDRGGGVARRTREAILLCEAAGFDAVLVETVGVGQAETEVADVADTVVVVVQPGGGDVLQFLKAGIMETPDVLVVTKVDLGQIAIRTAQELAAALRSLGMSETRVLAVCSLAPVSGVEELLGALSEHRRAIDLAERRLTARRASALGDFTHEHGERGLRALGGRRGAERLLADQSPALDAATLVAVLERATNG